MSKSRSSGRFAHLRVGASGGYSGGHRNVLALENFYYVAVCLAAQGASAPTEGGEGRGHIVFLPFFLFLFSSARLQVAPGDESSPLYA